MDRNSFTPLSKVQPSLQCNKTHNYRIIFADILRILTLDDGNRTCHLQPYIKHACDSTHIYRKLTIGEWLQQQTVYTEF